MDKTSSRTGRRVVGAAAVLMRICLPAVGAGAEAAGAKAVIEAAGLRAGLIVHLDCGDGKFTAELARAGEFLVHGLSADAAAVGKAREHIAAAGLAGPASVERVDMAALPYADNLVNLIIADDLPGLVKAGLSLAEVARVLCPHGVALLGGTSEAEIKAALVKGGGGELAVTMAGRWVRLAKARPAGMDDWTHRRHGPDGNAVSADKVVEVPRNLRWVAGPKWPYASRKNCGSAIIADDRRVFTIQSPAEGARLIARDAYNGLLLWQRPIAWAARTTKPIARGATPSFPLPLVAGGGKVFAMLEKNVVAFDAATGEIAGQYEAPVRPGLGDEAVYVDGVLLLATEKDVRAVEADGGRVKWSLPAKAVDLIAAGGKAFFLDTARQPYELVGVDLVGGKEAWRASTDGWGPWPVPKGLEGKPLALCFGAEGALVLAASWAGKGGGADARIYAVSADDGRHLWTYEYSAMQSLPRYKNVFYLDGLAWVYRFAGNDGQRVMAWEGLLLATGKVARTIKVPVRAKCQGMIALDRYLVNIKDYGFIDVKTGKSAESGAMVSACVIGSIPANGLVYNPQIACSCNAATVPGAQGLAGESGPDPFKDLAASAAGRLEKGPAYDAAQSAPAPAAEADSWPTYRGDALRRGSTAADVPALLRVAWQEQAAAPQVRPAPEDWERYNPGRITAPVVAAGRVFLAETDAHRLIALDAATGKPAWSAVLGGRIDSPPTIAGGLVLAGCRDGWVYCLRAADGEVVWRYRAAPAERRIVAYGQIESAWPVPGSVLVAGETAYFCAGRTTAIDGGLAAHAVALRSGKPLWAKHLENTDRHFVQQFRTVNDVLVSDGQMAFLRNWSIDLKTGADGPAYRTAPAALYLRSGRMGMLDDAWCRFRGTYHNRQSDWYYGGYYGVHGQMLSFGRDGQMYGCETDFRGGRGPGRLFAIRPKIALEGSHWRNSAKPSWEAEIKFPAQAEAMISAGQAVFAAGPADRSDPGKGGVLWAFSAADGKGLSQYPLPARPAFDGLAAAYGRVYVSLQDGRVCCLAAAQPGGDGRSGLRPDAQPVAAGVGEAGAAAVVVGGEGHFSRNSLD